MSKNKKIPSFSSKYISSNILIRNYLKKNFSLKECNSLIKAITRQTLMKMTEITTQLSELELLVHSAVVDIDWEQVSREVKRSKQECEWEWRNRKFPLLNFKEFTCKELQQLQELIIKYKGRNWIQITREFGGNRVPWFVYKTFVKRIKKVNLRGKWTSEEDLILKKTVQEIGTIWTRVAVALPYRSPAQCLQRWNFSLSPQIKKGRWSKEEDLQLLKGFKEFGKKWNKIQVHGRTVAQIRERFENVLNPQINRGPWTDEERKILLDLVGKIGHKWSIISRVLVNRTDNMCKREWERIQNRD